MCNVYTTVKTINILIICYTIYIYIMLHKGFWTLFKTVCLNERSKSIGFQVLLFTICKGLSLNDMLYRVKKALKYFIHTSEVFSYLWWAREWTIC